MISDYRFMLGRIIGIKHWNMDLGTCLHEIYIDSNTTHGKEMNIRIIYGHRNNPSNILYKTVPQHQAACPSYQT